MPLQVATITLVFVKPERITQSRLSELDLPSLKKASDFEYTSALALASRF
jgi:hypothetical protein